MLAHEEGKQLSVSLSLLGCCVWHLTFHGFPPSPRTPIGRPPTPARPPLAIPLPKERGNISVTAVGAAKRQRRLQIQGRAKSVPSLFAMGHPLFIVVITLDSEHLVLDITWPWPRFSKIRKNLVYRCCASEDGRCQWGRRRAEDAWPSRGGGRV